MANTVNVGDIIAIPKGTEIWEGALNSEYSSTSKREVVAEARFVRSYKLYKYEWTNPDGSKDVMFHELDHYNRNGDSAWPIGSYSNFKTREDLQRRVGEFPDLNPVLVDRIMREWEIFQKTKKTISLLESGLVVRFGRDRWVRAKDVTVVKNAQ